MLCVTGLILGLVLLNSPRGKEDTSNATDFSSFYCAAQIVRAGLGSQLYDLRLQKEFQSRVAAVHAFYNHAPYEAILFVPFTLLSYRTAYWVWTVCNVVLLAWATLILDRSTGVRQALSQFVRIEVDRGLLFVVFLTFAPVTTCLLLGENSMLTLLIFAGTFALFRAGRGFLGGALLALGLFKFQLILPIVLILGLRRKWHFLSGFSASAFLLVVVSMAVSGTQVLWEYPRFIAFESGHPELAGFHPIFMPNLRGLFSLLAFGYSGRVVLFAVAIASALTIVWTAKNWRADVPSLSFSASVLASMLVSFHLYNYDLSLVLIPVSILCGALVERGVLLQSRAIWVTLAVLFVNPLHLLLLFHNLYAVMCLPLLILLFGTMRLSQSRPAVANTLPMVPA